MRFQELNQPEQILFTDIHKGIEGPDRRQHFFMRWRWEFGRGFVNR